MFLYVQRLYTEGIHTFSLRCSFLRLHGTGTPRRFHVDYCNQAAVLSDNEISLLTQLDRQTSDNCIMIRRDQHDPHVSTAISNFFDPVCGCYLAALYLQVPIASARWADWVKIENFSENGWHRDGTGF